MKSENSTPTILMPMAAKWFFHLEVTGRSRDTIEGDGHLIRRFDRFLVEKGCSSLATIVPAHVDAWRADLVENEIGAATVAAMIGRIYRFFSWLHENRCVQVAPSFIAHRVSVARCPSEDEIQRLLKSVSGSDPVAQRDRAIFEIAYSTGARSEELSCLNLDAVKGAFIRLVGRTGRERLVPLTKTAVAALRVYLADARPRLLGNEENRERHAVFFSNRKSRFTRRAIEITVKIRSHRCGLKLTWNAIRLAFSAHLLRDGSALADVSEHWLARHAGSAPTTGGAARAARTNTVKRHRATKRNGVVSEPAAPVRFQPGADAWLEHMRARNLSPHTIRHACIALVRFDAFLESRNAPAGCASVSKLDLEEWLASHIQAQCAPSYVETMLSAVIRFFGWMEKRGEIFQNPATGLQLPRFHRRMQPVPSETEVNRLLGGVSLRSPLGIRDRAILETAYASGLRIAELARMNVDSVDLHHGTVRVVGKGSRERVVPLTSAAIKVLGLYLAGPREKFLLSRDACPALWISSKEGERMTAAGLHEVVVGRAKDAGLKLSMQSLRRAFATHLLHHGASPMDLKLFLGHATFKHLKHYLRYAPEELRAAHNRSNLGR